VRTALRHLIDLPGISGEGHVASLLVLAEGGQGVVQKRLGGGFSSRLVGAPESLKGGELFKRAPQVRRYYGHAELTIPDQVVGIDNLSRGSGLRSEYPV
jgi:hypothetical protein